MKSDDLERKRQQLREASGRIGAQVKAKRLGVVEDPSVASIFTEAHEALHNAPTDLGLAGRLIRRYQQALGATPSTPEAGR